MRATTPIITNTQLSQSAEFFHLYEARLARLVKGQFLLLDRQVKEILSSSSIPDDAAIERVVSETKAWLRVFISEGQKVAKGSRFIPTIHAEVILGNISQAEFLGGRWVSDNWDNINSNVSKYFSNNLGTQAQISEYQLNQLTESVRDDLSRICMKRMIDVTKNQPQRGLEFSVSPNNLNAMLSDPGSIIWIVEKERKLVGMFIAYLDLNPLSEGGKKIVSKWANRNFIDVSEVAYGELVVTDPFYSKAMNQAGVNPYKNLLEPVKDSLRVLGFRHLLGEVRVGRQANTALPRHLEEGFTETDFEREKNGHTLRLLVYDLNGNSSFKISNAVPLFEFAGNPLAVTQYLRNLNREFADPKVAYEYAKRVLRKHDLDRHIKAELKEGLTGDKSHIVFSTGTLNSGSQQTLFQSRRGFDEWTGLRYVGTSVVTFRIGLSAILSEFCNSEFGVRRREFLSDDA